MDFVSSGVHNVRDVADNFIVHGDKNDFQQEHGDGVGITTSALLRHAYPQMRWFVLYSTGDKITAKAPTKATDKVGQAPTSPTSRTSDVDRPMVAIRVKSV